MPKFKISDKVYDIPQDQVEDFLSMASEKGYQVQQFEEPQMPETPELDAGKTQPQVTGAPVEETAAPDMESNLVDISLASFREEQSKLERKIGKKTIEDLDPTGLVRILPEGTAINLARAGAFLGRTVAGIADAATNVGAIGIDFVNPIAGPLNVPAFLAASPEQRKKRIEKLRETYDLDFSELYNAADAIDNLKPKYFDEKGEELDISRLFEKGEFNKAFDVAISDAVASAPSLAISTAFPLLGSAMLGISTTGQTFEQELKERPDATLEQLYASSFLKGAAEFGTEYAGGKLTRYFAGLKGTTAPTEAIRDLAQNAIVKVLTKAGGGFVSEGGTELATSIAQDLTDVSVYGDNLDWPEILRRGFNSFVVGGLTGGPTSGAGTAVNIVQNRRNKEKVYEAAAPLKAQQELFRKRAELSNIKENTSKLPKELQSEFDEYINEAEKEVKDLEKNIYDKFNNLSKKELLQYANQLDEAGKQTFIARSKIGDKQVKDRAAEKAKKALQANQELFGDIEFYDAKLEEKIGTLLKNSELIAEKYKRQIGYLPSDFKMVQLSADELVERTGREDARNADGVFDDNVLYINKDVPLNTNVGGHEILHAKMSQKFKTDNESMRPLVNAFRSYLNESEEGKRILSIIDKRIKNFYTDENGNLKKGALEEYLNIFTDVYANEGINYNESKAEKLKNVTNNIIKGLGINNVVELNTGEDVFNFLKDYTKNINSKNPFLVKAAMNVKIKSNLLTEKPVNEEDAASTEKQIKQSISAKDKQDMMDTYNRLMEGVERTEYSKNNPLPRRLENELVPKFYGYVNTLVNKKFRQVEEEAIEKEDAVMILMAEVANALRTFNPAKNDDISGYVASIIARRQSMIFADVKEEFTDDVETSKAAQAVVEEIAEVKQEQIQENKKETLLEAIDVTRTVEGKTYEEHVINVVSKNARLAIKVYGEEVSANRTVTPFIARVKDGLAKDLRQITKKFINEYGYEAFLKDHKPAILKNFTTTYLAKHPLFRKGIEKSIGGKMVKDNQGNLQFEPNWTLPTQTKLNKYEWVDTNGKKAKIDRDNAGARGLTSGPEIIRRSPKINSIISDNEFIDYHFQDGALRKKKKQNPEDALAMQIASEIGFDLLKQDLITDGEISQQLREVGELFDFVIAEAEMNKLSKDIDRGTVKFSKSSNNPSVKLLAENVNSASAASEILTQSINQIASKDSQLAEELLSLNKAQTVLPIVDKILVPALENAIQNAKTDFEKIAIIKEFLTVYKEPVRQTTKTAQMPVLRTLEQFGLRVEKALKGNDKKLIKTIDLTKEGVTEEDFNNDKTPIKIKLKPYGKLGYQSELYINNEKLDFGIEQRLDQQPEYENLVDGKISKTKIKAQNQQALERLKNIVFEIGEKNPALAISLIELAKQPQRGFFRGAAMLNGVVLNPGPNTDPKKTKNKYEKLEYEHNPPIDHVYKEIIKYLESPSEKAKQNLEKLLDTMEANLVPESFHNIVNKDHETTTPTDGTGRYDRALKETNYKFDTNTFRFSISSNDKIRLNDMVSETGGLTKAEISEATATRIAKNKGKFRFYIPPSADDFAGLMYYLLRKGDLGNEDMAFIKEKLLDPFAKNHAAWESYKHRKLNEFRQFKKLIRKSPTAKLTAKNNMGFTNEDAVRVWIWNKKGTDLGNTITNAEKANLIEIVESNPDLLQFAESMVNLFAGAQNYPDPTGSWFNGSITIDVIENINEFGRKKFFETFNNNVEELFGKLDNKGEISGPIANKLRAAYGNNYVEALSDIIYRMKNGRAREFGKNRLMNQFNNWISNSVGAVMFFNTRSALLQQVSMINFINLTDNNPIKFAQAIANPKQYWSDYLYLLNSDFLVSRRDGIKIDVNQDEIAKAAESGKNPVQSVISLILKKGFALTTWGDSHAIATGGATFYRNRINTYLKEGLSQAEAEEKAFFEFKELAEEAQQSSRPDRISQQQASTLGRIILAWANTPMQYARLTKKATLDLINGRGDWKTNMSRIVYYGAVQNLMFTYMQQGLFSMIFDGEDEEEEDAKKWEFTFNSMADGFLRGLGFGGAIASTAKNMVLEAIEQSKGRGNYDEVVWEALKLSPPLGSKIAKARAVGRTFGWKQEREKVFSEGWSLDNPAFEAVGKAVSATTNIPLDRVIRKLDNISYPMRHDVEFWQAAALYLGWGQWELGLKDVNKNKQSLKVKLKGLEVKSIKVK